MVIEGPLLWVGLALLTSVLIQTALAITNPHITELGRVICVLLFSVILPSVISLAGRRHRITWEHLLPTYWLTVNLCALGLILFGCSVRVWKYLTAQ